ncbi:MAG: ribose-phosphate pyrophosphokinase [Ruminiclostridium sp.]|nr:ribose-phosphate pyrophosphokinase [Ruminiclostridium sp.]
MTTKASQIVLNTQDSVAPIGIIAMDGAKELGNKINNYLVSWAQDSGINIDSYLIETTCPRFSSGDAKALIKESIRGDDIYILVDTGNYSCTYPLFGRENCMSPDDHYQDLKRIIQAMSGKAHRINVIMPLLYGGRQHRRNYRESLDCAVALQELAAMSVENIICFDAHDARVCNAIPLIGFDNVMPTYQVLKTLFRSVDDLNITPDTFAVVSPDEGAMHRNMYYASVLGVQLGMFYKRRDYSRVVNGRNPIVAHEYLGNSVAGKDIFIADDIISSGESMLDVASELKKRNARRIIGYATYPIFTNGVDKFDQAVKEGIIDHVLGTNLTYRCPELLAKPWFHEVDVSKYIAYFITALNHDVSISKIIDPHSKIKNLLQQYGVKGGDNI